jgi:hypothetical protein
MDLSVLSDKQTTQLERLLEREGLNTETLTDEVAEDRWHTTDARRILNALFNAEAKNRRNNMSAAPVTEKQISLARLLLTGDASRGRAAHAAVRDSRAFAPTINDLKVLAYAPRQVKSSYEASQILDGFFEMAESIGYARPQRSDEDTAPVTETADEATSDDAEPF